MELDTDRLGEESVPLSELDKLLRPDRNMDIAIKEKFSIANFDNPGNTLAIKGAKVLLTEFHFIDIEQKYDLVEDLSDIEYIGLTDKNQVILNFKKGGNSSASGIYDFTDSFFDELFHMEKFAKFCIKNDYEDLIRENVTNLIEKLGSLQKQYRFIIKNGENYVRGLTSNKYRNYDNNIVLFISLLYLHRFAIENKVSFSINHARMSDSAIKIIFEQQKPVRVPGVGKVYFGIVISNSEVKESAFSLEMRYRLVDANDSTKSFAAIPVLKDSIFHINHMTSMGKMEEKVKEVDALKEAQQTMFELIKGIKELGTISDDAIYNLFRKIKFSHQNFSANTRKNMETMYENDIINNTMSLLQAFDKVNSITSDLDERIFLERIYHELIKEQIQKNRKKKNNSSI